MHLATWRMAGGIAARFRSFRDLGCARPFAAGEMLYAQGEAGDAFHFVERGFVRIAILREDGTEVGLEVMGPDTICGEGAVFDRLPRFSTATAITPVDTIAFSRKSIAAMLRREPDFALDLLGLVSEKQRVLAVKLERFATRDPAGRILELLTRQAVLFGVDVPDGCLIATRLTQEEIASQTGTSRVTVTRTLQRLVAENVVAKERGYYVLRHARPDHSSGPGRRSPL